MSYDNYTFYLGERVTSSIVILVERRNVSVYYRLQPHVLYIVNVLLLTAVAECRLYHLPDVWLGLW